MKYDESGQAAYALKSEERTGAWDVTSVDGALIGRFHETHNEPAAEENAELFAGVYGRLPWIAEMAAALWEAALKLLSSDRDLTAYEQQHGHSALRVEITRLAMRADRDRCLLVADSGNLYEDEFPVDWLRKNWPHRE